MTGLCWFVQWVHYPLLREVGEKEFPEYERAHAARTTLLTAFLMLVELATAVYFAFKGLPYVPYWIALAALGLSLFIWASTFLIQVPYHAQLSEGKDPAIISRLIGSNWFRTIAWTARSGILLWDVAGKSL